MTTGSPNIRIRKLNDALSNQIAAGEVVERPGAALKELLENSLDAGSTAIRVHIKEGGFKLIEVTDNGKGIHPEDLPLALDRHATSKIQKSEDLFAIKSWGFRGEALASIAAVSRLKISSRTNEFHTGREIICEATQVAGDKAVARPVGSSVQIEELFFNTPARKKFLKSQAAETSFCIQVIHRLALASPEVSWEVWIDDNKSFIYPAVSKIEERISNVFSDGLKSPIASTELIPFSNIKPNMHVWGFMLPISTMLATSRGIFTFVNKRSVKDKLLQQAITTAAREILFGEQYPQIVLFLDTPPEEVDVNVHPTKAEVRFRNSNHVFGLIRNTIERTLASLRPQNIPAQENTINEPSTISMPMDFATHFHQKAGTYPSLTGTESGGFRSTESVTTQKPYTGPQFLGTLRNTYILCQDDEGLLLVDQHAAHERVTYQKLRAKHLNKQSSPLLIPLLVEIPEHDLNALENEFVKLESCGLFLDRAGKTQVRVREIPSLLIGTNNAPRIDLGILIRSLAEHLENSPESITELVEEEILHTLATQSCHGSVRAGQTLSHEEAFALLQQMENTDFSGHCPHGRPTTVRLNWQAIEKLFKRIV